MSLIAGIQGQPAELIDGAKVNSLIPLTAGNGVQLEGRTNGVAIEAGKVGEVKTSYVQTLVYGSVTASVWTDTGCSISLDTGRWRLDAYASVWIGGGNGTGISFRLGQFAIFNVTDAAVIIAGFSGCADASKSNDVSTVSLSRILDIQGTKVVATRFTSVENTSATTITSLAVYGGNGYPITLIATRIA